MKTFTRNDSITHPRQFKTYRWYKPILVIVLMAVFMIIFTFAVELITKFVFQANVSSTGYDDMDFFSAAGAFSNGASAAAAISYIVIAVLAVFMFFLWYKTKELDVPIGKLRTAA